MADVVVHGPVSWNQIVSVDVLPDPSPHMQFATAHHQVLGGTSAGKAAHLRELGVDVELHTVLGTDLAASRPSRRHCAGQTSPTWQPASTDPANATST